MTSEETGVEGVLVIAQVVVAQAVLGWEDRQGEVDRTFSEFLGGGWDGLLATDIADEEAL